jgi:hypothetical protein
MDAQSVPNSHIKKRGGMLVTCSLSRPLLYLRRNLIDLTTLSGTMAPNSPQKEFNVYDQPVDYGSEVPEVGEKLGTTYDRKDMDRLGKVQQFKVRRLSCV